MQHDEQEPEILRNGSQKEGEELEPSEEQRVSLWAELFSAEALSIASFLVSIPTWVGVPGVVQTFVIAMASNSTESFSTGLAVGFGGAAAAGALLAWGAVSRSGPYSQPWTRWLAGAVLIVQLPLLAVIAVAGWLA